VFHPDRWLLELPGMSPRSLLRQVRLDEELR